MSHSSQVLRPSSIRASSCGHRVGAFLLLPGEYTVGHTFVEIGRAYGSLYPPEPHPLPYFVAHTGQGEGDTLALQLLDKVQQRVAALVSMKFTESASSSTCFAGGRFAASAAFSPSSK